tara:strand:- start:130 stop:318 length:189 start_codon:yes stop_codon:yes gene_type:complete
MYVCICRQVTDHQIRDICRGGVSDFPSVQAQTGVASQCGKCDKLAQTIVKEFSKSPGCGNTA